MMMMTIVTVVTVALNGLAAAWQQSLTSHFTHDSSQLTTLPSLVLVLKHCVSVWMKALSSHLTALSTLCLHRCSSVPQCLSGRLLSVHNEKCRNEKRFIKKKILSVSQRYQTLPASSLLMFGASSMAFRSVVSFSFYNYNGFHLPPTTSAWSHL